MRLSASACLRSLLAPVAALLLVAAPGAQAQIFGGGDNEARKAIIDLRARLDQNAENMRASQAASERLRAELSEQVKQLQRSVLELNATIEQLRGELAGLRGADEQALKAVADQQRRVTDLQQDLDARLRKLEPQRVNVDGREFLAQQSESREYNDALTLLRQGDFPSAATALNGFVVRYPESGYALSAHYWLGNAQYGNRDYLNAIESFRKLVTRAPQHPRSPEAVLAIANCQIELGQKDAAKQTLAELLRVYPKAEAAQAARDRLANLK